MSFKDDLRALCIKAGEKTEMVVRKTALELQSQMIERSPVGDPSGWKANAEIVGARTAYAEGAADYNAANPGKRRIGTSKASLNRIFKLKAGSVYTGGRFKGNWQVGIGTMNNTNDSPIDKSGAGALGRTQAALEGWKPGQTIFLSNSLPYAKRLESGWSKQAPAGIVALTTQNYAQAVKKAVSESK